MLNCVTVGLQHGSASVSGHWLSLPDNDNCLLACALLSAAYLRTIESTYVAPCAGHSGIGGGMLIRIRFDSVE